MSEQDLGIDFTCLPAPVSSSIIESETCAFECKECNRLDVFVRLPAHTVKEAVPLPECIALHL